MSNIGFHTKKVNDLGLDSYDYYFTDVFNQIKTLKDKDGAEDELGKYVVLAENASKNMTERANNMLKTENNTSSNYSDNYFEPTYMPCYTRIGLGNTSLVVPTGATKYNYVMNKKNDNNSHIDNLIQNTELDIAKDDGAYTHFYKFEKEFTIYNELIAPSEETEGKVNIGKYEAHSNSVWDNSVYTRLNGGNDWHPPPKKKDEILQHEFRVLKTKPPYRWMIYNTDDQNIDDNTNWNEGWRDRSSWLKFEYKNITENKVRAWFIIDNIKHHPDINNLNYELNGLFDGKTYKCRKISMPTRDNEGNCSTQTYISDKDYNYLKNKHPTLFSKCNRSGFRNEYTKVKKHIGSGYIFATGLLMLYLIHRLFNRK